MYTNSSNNTNNSINSNNSISCNSVPVCIYSNSVPVCMVISHLAEYNGSTGRGRQSCSWSDEQGKWIFPCPRSRLKMWSPETGSAVPSRASLLTHGIPPDFCGCGHLFISTAIRHRIRPEFIWLRGYCVPMAGIPNYQARTGTGKKTFSLFS